MQAIQRIFNLPYKTLAEQLGYSKNDTIVIVNIDDIGLHRDETEASLQVLEFGIVKTGSVMVPCPNFHRIVEWCKDNPDSDLGIHLTLTCEWGEKYPWKPILPESKVPTLYNNDGIMWADVNELLLHAKREEIILELSAQIEKMFDGGIKPTHLDHHMDFYYETDLFSDIMELSREYNLPMRVWRSRRYKLPFIKKNNLHSLRRRGFVFPDTQMGIYTMGGHDQSLDFRKAKYFEHLRSLTPGVHNIKVHIAFQTEDLENIMGHYHSSIRQIDYDVWTSDDTKKIAEELGIIFIGFRPLQQLQRELMKKP